MDQILSFQCRLLKPYVDQYNLSFMITNRKGIPVETVNGSHLEFLDYMEEVLLEPYDQIIAMLSDVSIPVSYDIQIPGVHILVVPVRVVNENEYYIWTGILLEEHNPDLILEYLIKATHNPHKWVTIFAQMPMISLENLDLLTSQLTGIEGLATQFLTARNNELDFKAQIDMIQQLSAAIRSHQSFSIPNLLSSILSHMKGIEWCGYAMRIKEDTYRIIEVSGVNHAHIIGAQFSSGEGFLGQIGLYDEFRSLQSAVNDPRLHLFQQRGLVPNHIYGSPVKDDIGVCGILFAGTQDPHIHFSEHIMQYLQIITDMYGSFLELDNNKTKLRRQKAYLASVTEVSRVMNTVHDLRRLLFILIDISLNLVNGSNASYLIYYEPDASKAQIVSRGISANQAEEYTQDILRRKSMFDSAQLRKVPLLKIKHTGWGDQVLECIIMCRGEARGMLSISLPDQSNAEEYMIVFETFVYLGGIALERLIDKQQEVQDQKIVTLLHEALGCWNPDKYQTSNQMRETALDFATYLQLPSDDIALIESACLITPYSMGFIRQQQLAPNVITLCEEYHRAGADTDQSKMTNSIPCQVLLLSDYYANHENSDAVIHVHGIEQSIMQKFENYILRDRIINYEISMDETQSGVGNLIDFDALQKTIHISTREKEVLELIVQGFNNRDIAESLFISEHTVKNHITKLFQKLKVTDRAQAIALAYRVGFQS